MATLDADGLRWYLLLLDDERHLEELEIWKRARAALFPHHR